MKTEIWPVIHLDRLNVAYENADIAFNNGCEGIFCIDMQGKDLLTDKIATDIKERWPDKKVGVNYLSENAFTGFVRAEKNLHDAFWADNSGITSAGINDIAKNVIHFQSFCRSIWYFASIGFKYQKTDSYPELAAQFVINNDYYHSIPTTSGVATGKPPSEDKLKKIRDHIGESRYLGVASGVNPENVKMISKYVSHILVSTGISKDFYRFDEEKLKELIRNCI